jgi:hypothetical protein
MIVASSSFAEPLLPDFSSAVFSNSLQIDNPYWPLVPGTVHNFEGVKTDPETGETETETIVLEVLNETRTVSGIETRIVRDRVFLEGLLIEDTFDWYAQDDDGNVWYMGEEVTDFEYDDDGNLIGTSHPGQWEAGVNGALPGYIMEANPQVGDNYYQEYLVGEAVDEGTVLALGESISVPAGSFDNVLRIRDSSALFPEFGHKSFAPGIGVVQELDFDETGNHVGTVDLLSVVPEPGSLSLLVTGGVIALIGSGAFGRSARRRLGTRRS